MTLKDFILDIISLILYIIPIIFIMTVVVFMYGIVLYLSKSGSETDRKKGIQFMIYGIIGLTVMIAVWSIVGLFSDSLFGINPNIIKFR